MKLKMTSLLLVLLGLAYLGASIGLRALYDHNVEPSTLTDRVGVNSVNGILQRPSFEEKMASRSRELHELSAVLQQKLTEAKATPAIGVSNQTCAQMAMDNYDDRCNSTERQCVRTNLLDDPRERLQSLLVSNSVFEDFEDGMAVMRDAITSKYDVLILNAVSSDHYNESQAMLENFHNELFPVLKNFRLIIYDIGLTKDQRKMTQKHCNCTVLSFPFHKFPTHVSTLMCYAWKPLIVAAHYDQAEVLMWADSSVRFRHSAEIPELIRRTKDRGVQQRRCFEFNKLPHFTLPRIFEHFGDSPCAFMSVPMVEGNFALYHREPLVRRAVIEPWLACAATESCICPLQYRSRRHCFKIPMPIPNRIGLRNCYDQSVMSVILAKLFRENYFHFVVDTSRVQLTYRGYKSAYFDVLEKRITNTAK